MTQKNRGLKHRVPFSNTIEKNYMIHLKVIQKTKTPMYKMLDEAVEDYLKKHEIKYWFLYLFFEIYIKNVSK